MQVLKWAKHKSTELFKKVHAELVMCHLQERSEIVQQL